METTKILYIQTLDGVLGVSESAAKQSETIKNMLEDCPSWSEKDTFICFDYKIQILEKIFFYCQHLVEENKCKNECEQWDDETFMSQFSNETLTEIILASNFLHIPSLLNLGTKTVADRIMSAATA